MVRPDVRLRFFEVRCDGDGCETVDVGFLIFMVSVPCCKLMHMIIFAHVVSQEMEHLPRDLGGIIVLRVCSMRTRDEVTLFTRLAAAVFVLMQLEHGGELEVLESH